MSTTLLNNIINNNKNLSLSYKIYHKLVNLNYISNIKYFNFYNTNNNIKYIKHLDSNINYMKNFYKPSHKIKVNYKELKKLTNMLKSGILLLSSSMGIITNKKALLLKIGGILLYYIN